MKLNKWKLKDLKLKLYEGQQSSKKPLPKDCLEREAEELKMRMEREEHEAKFKAKQEEEYDAKIT